MTFCLAILWAMACRVVSPQVVVSSVPSGIEVHTEGSIQQIDIHDGDVLISTRQTKKEVQRHWVPVPWAAHSEVTVTSIFEGAVQRSTVTAPNTLDTVRVSAPMGQDLQPLSAGDSTVFSSIGEKASSIAVTLQVMKPGAITVSLDDTVLRKDDAVYGEHLLVSAPSQGETQLRITTPDGDTRHTLVTAAIPLNEAQRAIEVARVRYPTDSLGSVELSRPQGIVSLPSRWWSQALRSLGLSFRPRDRTVPWAHQAITLSNTTRAPLNVVVRSRITTGGLPDPVFTPRLRDVDDGTGWTSAILRVPPGASADAILPVFVDEELLGEDNRARLDRTHTIEVSALGSLDTIASASEPLYIQRGSTAAMVAMAAGIMASLAGILLLTLRLKTWLKMPTTTLVTAALFGTLSFVVNAAMQLVGMGVASVLGPFAFIATGLMDDTIRALLLITLLKLRPMPGVCAMAVILGWLLRAVTTGAASPSDLLYLTGHIFFLEASLWVFGLTRGARLGRTRLALAFSTCFSASIATALAFNVVLYRLFYADWYVILNIGLSGIAYPIIATVLAMPVAASLQKVED